MNQKVYLILVNDKIFKAFLKKEQAEEYFQQVYLLSSRKIIRKLADSIPKVELICIPAEEEADFNMAIGNTAHAGAGSNAKNYELEHFPLSF